MWPSFIQTGSSPSTLWPRSVANDEKAKKDSTISYSSHSCLLLPSAEFSSRACILLLKGPDNTATSPGSRTGWDGEVTTWTLLPGQWLSFLGQSGYRGTLGPKMGPFCILYPLVIVSLVALAFVSGEWGMMITGMVAGVDNSSSWWKEVQGKRLPCWDNGFGEEKKRRKYNRIGFFD